jgi:plasmid maintenance system killer protein
VIQSFKSKKTKRLFEGKRIAQFQAFDRQAQKRLRVLDAADTLEALRMLPRAYESTTNGVFVLNGAMLAPRMLK